jgi:threonylcarbamoyladenosine tRNA methylthiotransferase MtaB
MFENSRELIDSIDCTYLHVFPFSKRPGTRAAVFEDQIAAHVKQKRVETLRVLSREKSSAFYRRFIHSKRVALLETEKLSDDRLRGYTDNYIPVVTALPRLLPGTPVVVELIGLAEDSVEARIV